MSGEDISHDGQAYLCEYAFTQLTVVLTSHSMQLRRLVIAQVTRFPELARVLCGSGPKRAISQLSTTFELLAERGLLTIDDPALAASHYNSLVMSAPLNQAMLLGDQAIPGEQQLRQYAEQLRLASRPMGYGAVRVGTVEVHGHALPCIVMQDAERPQFGRSGRSVSRTPCADTCQRSCWSVRPAGDDHAEACRWRIPCGTVARPNSTPHHQRRIRFPMRDVRSIRLTRCPRPRAEAEVIYSIGAAGTGDTRFRLATVFSTK